MPFLDHQKQSAVQNSTAQKIIVKKSSECDKYYVVKGIVIISSLSLIFWSQNCLRNEFDIFSRISITKYLLIQ